MGFFIFVIQIKIKFIIKLIDFFEKMNQEPDYETERQKLKLGPFATCVMIFKTTVGVGIFTFQYCYASVRNQNNHQVWDNLGAFTEQLCPIQRYIRRESAPEAL